MKISSKLEEMVADLVSDEKAKREEVEGVLSQIHELTESYFKPPEPGSPAFVAQVQAITQPAEPEPQEPMPEPSLDAQFSNMVQFNMRRGGETKEEAERKARLALGIE